jgi:hypothetical protein
MDHPTLPSPIDRPAKRQRRVSHDAEDEPKMENHPQQPSNGTTIEPKVGHALVAANEPTHSYCADSSDIRCPYGGVYENSTLQRHPRCASPQTA